MPAYIHYRKFLTESGIEDCLQHFIVWVELYGELVLFDDGEG